MNKVRTSFYFITYTTQLDQIEEDDMDRACSMHGNKRNMLGRPEGKRLLGTTRPRLDCCIKMDVRAIELAIRTSLT